MSVADFLQPDCAFSPIAGDESIDGRVGLVLGVEQCLGVLVRSKTARVPNHEKLK